LTNFAQLVANLIEKNKQITAVESTASSSKHVESLFDSENKGN